MMKKHSALPDFWGREGRGGEEWDVVERTPGPGNELGPQGFEKPPDKTAAERIVQTGTAQPVPCRDRRAR